MVSPARSAVPGRGKVSEMSDKVVFVDAGRYFGPQGVPKNKLGIDDPAQYAEAVAAKVAEKRAEIAEVGGLGGNYRLAHVRQFHERLFSDVFDWAGNTRDVEIEDPRFVRLADFEKESEFIFLRLENEEYFKGLEKADVADRLAYYVKEVYRLHPFVAGEREAVTSFFCQMLGRLRYAFKIDDVPDDELYAALDKGLNDDLAPLTSLFEGLLEKQKRKREKPIGPPEAANSGISIHLSNRFFIYISSKEYI